MKIKQFGEVYVVSLQGRVDHTVAEGFKSQIMKLLNDCESADAKVVISMEEVDYMSSVGLRVMLIAAKHCKQEGGEVLVSALHSTMQEIFEISRFDRIFKTFNSTEEAIGYFDHGAAQLYAESN